MTAPNFSYPSYYPSADQEWSTFLKRRSELLTDLETRFKLSQILTQQDPSLALNIGAAQAAADSLANTHQVQGQNQDGSLTRFQQSRQEPTHEEVNELLGAAQFWGIPNAEKIPPKALRNIIEAKRLSSAAEGRGGLNPLADVGLTALAAIGLGTTQGLISIAQHIPFIGDAVAANQQVQKSSQWLHSLNEGVQAGMSEGERTGYRIAHGLGGLLGNTPLFGAAWKVAGSVGGLGAVTSGAVRATPIMRGAAAAAQGGISAWMLEGGGDQSVEEAAMKVAFGAGLGVAGVALAEGLPRIAQKIRDAFPSRFTSEAPPLDRRGFAQRPNTVDAEWYFEADHQLQNPSGRPRGWLPESTGPEGTGGGGSDPFLAPRPSEPGTALVTQPAGALMSPERAAITERILALEETRDVARWAMETDGLTGLGNKRALERVRHDVDLDESLGWAVFDGKKFKLVNDTHGHGVGDQTLINFARAMTQAAQEMGIPARLFRQGGDEFSAIVPRDQLDDFTKRVTQLSYQKVGGVETWLDGYAHPTFGEADLTLMSNKRGAARSTPSIPVISEEQRNFELFAMESGATYLGRNPGHVSITGEHRIVGNIRPNPNLIPEHLMGASESLAAPEGSPWGPAPMRDEDYARLITQGNKTPTGVTQVQGNPRTAVNEAGDIPFLERQLAEIKAQREVVLESIPPEARYASYLTPQEKEYNRLGDQYTKTRTQLLIKKYVGEDGLAQLRSMSKDELISWDVQRRNAPPTMEAFDDPNWGERQEAWSLAVGRVHAERRAANPNVARAEQLYSKADELGFAAQNIREGAGSGNVAPHVGETYESLLGHGMFLTDMGMRIEAGGILSAEEQSLVDRLLRFDLDVTEAADEAAALTKQAEVLNSEHLPEVAAASEVTVADVVKAKIEAHPGEIHIIQRIGDVGKAMRELTQAQVEKRLMPHNFRLVERNGGVDLLVSDGRAISNKQVEQYRRYGYFEGQNVCVNGACAVVERADAGDNLAMVYDKYLKQSITVPQEQVMPSTSSLDHKVEYGPLLYAEFKDYVEDYMIREAAKVPDAKIDTDWLSAETSSQLPRLMDAFLEDRFVSEPISRAAYEAFFNTQRVYDFQNLASEELDELKRISEQLNNYRAINPVPYLPIEEIAGTKGFSYVATPGTRGGTLVDRLSDLRVPVENEDAAYEFLRGFNRELPDYSPISDVPYEIMGSNPHSANPGDDLEPIFEDPYAGNRDSMDSVALRVEREIEDMIQAVEGGALTQEPFLGGGGSRGGPPSPPSGPALGGGGWDALPPGRRPSLGEQFRVAHATRPRELHEVQQSLDGFLVKWFTPWRHVAAMVEHELKEIGITEGRLWAHQNAVSVAVDEAHNAALPWQVEWADIMSQYRRRLLRNGTVTKIAEIVDPSEQMRAMREAGYNDQEIVAQARIKDFNDRFFRMLVDDPAYNLDDSRYIAGYMSHIRMRQGQPGIHDPFAGGDQMLPPHLRFFAEMVRTGNMQFRQMDARVLGTKMIRSAFFKKFVDPPYAEMRAAWNDPRIPTKFRELALDWLEVVRSGHQPGGDQVIQGVRRMFNIMGVPLTDGEVGGLMNVGFGNMYRAQLGGRPDAIFRDAIQIFFTGVRIGFKPVNEVMLDMLRGGREVVQDIQQRALQGGYLVKGMAKVANADIWEAGVQTPEGVELLSESAQRRRETMARIGDVFWAATPKRLRNGLQGTYFDPLRYYTKLGELLRTVAGEAGYRVASKAVDEFAGSIRQMAERGVPFDQGEYDQLFQTLMKDSKARAYHRVVQDEFRRLVENGQLEEAKFLLANKAADHQFRYGAKENPIAVRKAGMTGRAIMQFGSFTNQYVGEMRDMFMAPGVHRNEKVAMALRYATVSFALGLLGAYTGWRFSKWQWHQSLTFAGGPVAGGIASTAQAATGAAAQAMGVEPSPAQANALRDWRDPLGHIAEGIGGWMNPYTSTLRTGRNLLDMTGSVNPIEGTARAVITGEASIQPDMRQFIDDLGQQTIWPQAQPAPPGSGAY